MSASEQKFFEFYKIRGISGSTERLSASQEGPCSVEVVALYLPSTTTNDTLHLLVGSTHSGASKTSLRLHKEPVRSSVRLRTAL
jgi:hypothetical protein